VIAYFVDGPLNGQTREKQTHGYTIYYAVAPPILVSHYTDLDSEPDSDLKKGVYVWEGITLADGRRVFMHRGVE